MSDLRACLADALREHEPFRINVDGGWIGCSCDGGFSRFSAAAHRSHLADVLLSLPSIAIVELPEPDTDDEWDGQDLGWWVGTKVNKGRIPVAVLQHTLGPNATRDLAAALLAAARAAEVTNCPGCGSTDPDRVHYAHCPKVGQH